MRWAQGRYEAHLLELKEGDGVREARVWVEESGRVEGTGAGAEGIGGEVNQGNGCWMPPCSAPNS